MNTDLSQASEAFVNALQAGLVTFDAGDREKAYQLFDVALDIEPDNVWGLLWKGATAPSPADTTHWLEQALALDPQNVHAATGIAWARDQMGRMPAEGVKPVPQSGSEPSDAAVAKTPATIEPAMLETATPADESLPDWLQEEPVPAAEAPVEMAPATRMDQPAAEASATIPDWLRDADSQPSEAQPHVATPPIEESSVTGAAEEEPTEKITLPAWLTDELPESSAAEATPTAIAGIEPLEHAPPTVADEALPAWLQEEAPGKAAGAGSEAAHDHYQRGLAYYEENRLEAAAEEFVAAAKLNPDHVETHNYLGSVYFLQGKPADAIQQFQGALTIDPDHAESHLNLGLVYQETGKADQAIEEFSTYLKLDPNSSIATEVKGFIDTLRG